MTVARDRVEIEGARARYRVSLTTGTATLQGGHQLTIPGTSTDLARVFLPHDDDPRAAELLALVLLLADDAVIVDPRILRQLERRGCVDKLGLRPS